MSEPLYQMWRRPKGEHRAQWQKMEEVAPATRSELFAESQKQLWVVREVECDFAIVPVGQTPVTGKIGQRQEPFSQTYRTKVLHPRSAV